MKKLALIIAFLMVASYAHAELCTGVTEATVGNHETFSFCWDPNPVEDDVLNYVIYKDGLVMDTVPVSMCNSESCNSPSYTENQKGVHVFTVRAVDTDGASSGDSNPVTLTIINVPPGNPGNFKKKN